MKKSLIILLIFFSVFSFVNAADLYQVFEPTFSDLTPSSIYVAGAGCSDNSCYGVTSNSIELYNGDKFITCWNNYGITGNGDEFVTCVANSKISGNVISLNEMSKFVVKEKTDASFGYIKQFFTSGDSYLPLYARSQNYQCEYDICVDTALKHLNFFKKANAIAEVGQLNIKNVDNPLLPVQINVPVKIEETICSAFRFVDSNMYRFYAPTGYSDYSANTAVNLKVTNVNTGSQYLDQTITIPIEADTCTGLAAFSWTPNNDLENYKVKFKVETDVIDNQVSSSIKDWAEVIETMYPKDLTGSCWTRAYDFTLSNVDSFDLTSSVAQITEGESLYALFRAGSWMGESSTPINYYVNVQFNGKTVYNNRISSSDSLSNQIVDLSPYMKDLQPGSYLVKLTTTPVNSQCTSTPSVVQTQNVQILAIDKYKVDFTIRDSDYNLLDNTNINLKLLSADDYFQETPTYNQNLVTNTFGKTTFNDVIAGNYRYVISKSGYTTITKDVHIASDNDIYVIISSDNVAPVINLPDEITEYYKNTVEINLRNYVTDFNDVFDTLTFNYNIASGNGNVNRVGDKLKISTSLANDVVLNVNVADPNGLNDNDQVIIHFIDNSKPEISNFYADPDNGAVDFTTTFYADVSDAENDDLTCTIDFGDGTIEEFNCNQISHTFNSVGTFNVKLTVEDGINTPVEVIEQIFVFQKKYSSPHIEYFNIDSTNDLTLPTDLSLRWDVTHPDGLPMTCTLRINGVNHPVNCNEDKYNINGFNIEGISRFTLTAYDGTNQDLRQIERNFINKENHIPEIIDFSANPNRGEGKLITNFNIDVYDEDGDELTCTLNFGDGNMITDKCSILNNIEYTYQPGNYYAELTISDGIDSNLALVSIIVKEDEAHAPVINTFSATPNTGVDTLTTVFNVVVSDEDGDELTCTLNFGDGTHITNNCEDIDTTEHFYNVGNYYAELIVNDGDYSINSFVNIVVTETENHAPLINSFSATPNTGVDTLTTVFNVIVSDEDEDELTCTLNFGDGTHITNNCKDIDTTEHFYNVGNYHAELIVTDGDYSINTFISIIVTEGENHAPVINSFSATPNTGVNTLTTVFNVIVSDEDEDDVLTCTLNFGDGTHITNNCEDIDTTEHFYSIGNYHAELIVTDGDYSTNTFISIVVTEGENHAPIINTFTATPNSGVNTLTSMFSVSVSDLDSEDTLTCTLNFGDGTHITNNCENINGQTHIYSPGTYHPELIVTDGKDSISRSVNVIVTEHNDVPIINTFSATPIMGVETLLTTFDIQTTDGDGDNLICNLNFGDGTQITNNCNAISSIQHYYNNIGIYIAQLSVTDGQETVFSTLTLTVEEQEKVAPTINWFTLKSSNLNVLPSDLTFDWSIEDPNGLSLNCVLKINNLTHNVPCIGNYNEFNYNISGNSVFELIGTNSLGLNTSKIISQNFVRLGDVDLDLNELNLIIDSVIIPGEFNFIITTRNETLARREINVEPIIVCDSVENYLNQNLKSTGVASGISSTSSRKDYFNFNLKTNTNDFVLNVPTNKACRFIAHVTDRYGTDFKLNANVMFKYPEVKHKIQSIRGKTTDIMNYMSSALLNKLKLGYNSIEFNLENNKVSDKKIVITVIIQKLNLAYTIEVNLGPEQNRNVQIPLFIKENTKAGLYPIRFSVYDGSDKQVRYSYIRVN